MLYPDIVHPNQLLHIKKHEYVFKWKLIKAEKQQKEAPRSLASYMSCLIYDFTYMIIYMISQSVCPKILMVGLQEKKIYSQFWTLSG